MGYFLQGLHAVSCFPGAEASLLWQVPWEFGSAASTRDGEVPLASLAARRMRVGRMAKGWWVQQRGKPQCMQCISETAVIECWRYEDVERCWSVLGPNLLHAWKCWNHLFPSKVILRGDLQVNSELRRKRGASFGGLSGQSVSKVERVCSSHLYILQWYHININQTYTHIYIYIYAYTFIYIYTVYSIAAISPKMCCCVHDEFHRVPIFGMVCPVTRKRLAVGKPGPCRRVADQKGKLSRNPTFHQYFLHKVRVEPWPSGKIEVKQDVYRSKTGQWISSYRGILLQVGATNRGIPGFHSWKWQPPRCNMNMISLITVQSI